MDEKMLEEQRLLEQLKALRPEVKKRRRMLFLVCGAALVSLSILLVCRLILPSRVSPMEVYGAFPLVSFLLFIAIVLVVGVVVESAENRMHETEGMIRDLHEIDG